MEGGDTETKKQGFMDKIRGMKVWFRSTQANVILTAQQDNLTDRVPQEHKDRANDHADRTKRFFAEEYFPEERRDQFIYRGKKVVVECQKHKDYQESIRWLLNYLEEYAGHGKSIIGQGNNFVHWRSLTLILLFQARTPRPASLRTPSNRPLPNSALSWNGLPTVLVSVSSVKLCECCTMMRRRMKS